MTRREARASLSPADRQRVAALAAQFGWTGLALTAWLLANELDGIPAETMLEITERVHQLVALPSHSRRVLWHEGRSYTVATVPHSPTGDNADVLLPPVPGKPTWTLVRCELPPLPGAGTGLDDPLGPGPDVVL